MRISYALQFTEHPVNSCASYTHRAHQEKGAHDGLDYKTADWTWHTQVRRKGQYAASTFLRRRLQSKAQRVGPLRRCHADTGNDFHVGSSWLATSIVRTLIKLSNDLASRLLEAEREHGVDCRCTGCCEKLGCKPTGKPHVLKVGFTD